MSANATRGDFVNDYVAQQSRQHVLGARLPMIAMIVVLLIALVATFSHGVAADAPAQDDDTTAVLLGP